MGYQITCATKDYRGVVQTIGGPAGSWTREQAVSHIKAYGVGWFYVQQPGTRPTEVHIYDGIFLRTDPDGDSRNNLDNLMACAR